MEESHKVFMRMALDLAAEAARNDEVPIGAIVVCEDKIVGTGFNSKETLRDPSAHAEILAIRMACSALGRWRLHDCVLYSTLEPCVMCAGACVQARIQHVVFGAHDHKFGGVNSLYQTLTDARANHRCSVTSGILEQESKALLQEFFRKKR